MGVRPCVVTLTDASMVSSMSAQCRAKAIDDVIGVDQRALCEMIEFSEPFWTTRGPPGECP